jgi:NADH:ubiquinone oxidoreductase subunit 5 (subunit L)/multisubunit Na+/H+ antiporter MnhA subunit
MWVPLAVLAALSICIGWFGRMPERHALGEGRYEYEGGRGLVGLIAEAQPKWAVSWQMEEAGHAPSRGIAEAQAGAEPAHEEHALHTTAMIVATCAMLAGVSAAWLVYRKGLGFAAKAARVLAPLHRLLMNKFYFDELYRATFVEGVLRLASLGRWFDRVILDGLADGSARWVARTALFSGLTLDNRGVDGLVNGVAKAALSSGNVARMGQTGRVRNYILAMTTAGAFVVVLFVWIW